MEVEKRSSKGGFLQLFDWNVKSRKKLFSNRPDAPESSKHGKENVDKMSISRLQQMKLDDSMHLPTGNDWASSMINDEASGSKVPGVVARLMGLDSLPTLDASDPPFIDAYSFRHSLHPRLTTEFEAEHQYVDYGMRNKLDGFSRNPVEDRLQKLQNRPIERFQSEALPPRSAKSVPITHHRMLSPIKSPGFVLSNNAAYIMEAASKMIDQSPQSTLNGRLPSFRSSSIPLRIRELKEKMEAEQKASRIHETSQRSKACTPVSSSKSQPRDKRLCQSEVVVLKNKHKSVSPVKTNILKLEGPASRNRSSMNQKEDGVKSSVQLDKKQRTASKGVHNRSTTGKTHDVLTQNNQKQNGVSHKDRANLKPRVPYQHYRKTSSTNGCSKEVKTSKKTVENSAVGTRRKESLPTTKSFSGKKRPTDGDVMYDGTGTNNVLIKEKERSVKCNITIDGSSNWESVDRKNGMDVVSFTFNSPIKKSVSESELTGQSGVKSRGLCLNFDDQPMNDSDALSVLLEQKLKELASLVETSQCETAKRGSNMNKDENVISHDSNISVDQLPTKTKPEFQGVEVTQCDSNNNENYESEIKHSCTSPSVEPSFTDDSSNSTTTLTSNGGNKQYMSATNMELLAEEIELQDSATSLPTTIFEFTSMSKWSSQRELEYIREILNHAELVIDDFAFVQTQKLINGNLFNQLENKNKNMDPFLKPQRKALFDCVSMCLEGRRERASSGSYEEWSTFVNKKTLLAGEIHKEIRGWTSMEELMVDEVVEKDMSNGNGKWLDFMADALEEGVVIETDILTFLIDEIVVDLLLC
ncbi:hypothetical protein M8C21_033913 [Ambrosia artemisiifolia]|uniref:Uncharacterized protein n=1 Tax=Ambrosia artemisiifolia TaxID=4212 RepID=A0AAD5CC94_AMBAR|nr:hypothetical protein M8C21_033913 [Ambrosia artemisiifolia]